MTSVEPPRAVVIPFGVPNEARGLGLGLAALVHAFVHVEGESVAIAQLHSRRNEEDPDAKPSPLEAFVPPAAWRDIAGRGDGPVAAGVVLTGSFEPPTDGSGTIRLLAFDARDGRTRASVDVSVDDERAGAALVEALERLWGVVGGEIGGLRGLRDLAWESLESVLLAERCALHDPSRGGPYDRLAAMLHLGRAIGDAPDARYPVERLASIALDTASGPALDAKLTSAAIRALERASADAFANLDLVDALAVLLLRQGRSKEAERYMNAAIVSAPNRGRSYSLLAQALRNQGKLDGALAVLQAGETAAGPDGAMSIERGMVLAAGGDLQGAGAVWRGVLDRDPLNPAAFGRLAALVLRRRDIGGAQVLVDSALAAPHAAADVLRSAIQLVVGTEGEGLPKASRLLRLGERLLERTPGDATGLLVVARALVALGEPRAALARLDRIEQVAPRSAAAAEAHSMRLAIEDPRAELEVQSVLRASRTGPLEALSDVSARARRLGTLHGAWLAWLAAGVAETRQARWPAARGALELALEAAPGAPQLHLELASVLLELDDADRAAAHAEEAIALGGASPPALGLLARAFAAVGRDLEATDVVRRALAMHPDEPSLRAVLEGLVHPAREDSPWASKLKRALRFFKWE